MSLPLSKFALLTSLIAALLAFVLIRRSNLPAFSPRTAINTDLNPSRPIDHDIRNMAARLLSRTVAKAVEAIEVSGASIASVGAAAAAVANTTKSSTATGEAPVPAAMESPTLGDMSWKISGGRSRWKLKNGLGTPEGKGAVVRRSIGTPSLRNLSPFLMLDNFCVSEGAGFPDHPHRGQATVTYMTDGKFQHEDFAGHKGVIGVGDLQWMIAGRGIMHAEMPLHWDKSTNPPTRLPDPVGLQLWVDLPAHAKMAPPSYQEYRASEIPTAKPRSTEELAKLDASQGSEEEEGHGWEVKVISGVSHGVESPVRSPEKGGCWYFDVNLEKGGRIFQRLPKGWNAFIYTLSGSINVGTSTSNPLKAYPPFHTLVLTNKAFTEKAVDPSTLPQEDGVEVVEATGSEGARFVVIAGEPLDQEVVQYGPFVMTSRKEIIEAMQDFQLGQNGFENASGWASSIGGRRRL